MTLINLLNELKADGVTRLVGLLGKSDINDYIDNAVSMHESSVEYAAMGISCHQYYIDHEDDFRIVTTPDGNRIIVDTDGFETPCYSTYETEEEMRAAFEAVQIAEQAEAIAQEMDAERPGELPHAAWVVVATAELKAAYAAAEAAFNREFPVQGGARI